MVGNNAVVKENKKTKADWEKFIHSDVLNFLACNGLQKVVLDDGSGNKATLRINVNGEVKVQITSVETM